MRYPSHLRAPLAPGLRLVLVSLVLAASLTACGKQQASGNDAAESAEATAADADADTEPGSASRGRAQSGLSAPVPQPAAPPVAPEAPMPPQPLPGTDAVIVTQQSGPAAASPGFDARAFAGTYSGSTTRLDIGAEGQFALDDSGQTLTGTWTLQPGGKTIVLDPDSKADTDRLLQLEADGSVRIAGGGALRKQ